MAFDNNYPNRKDKRKPYWRSKRYDRSCRPGGSCPYCRGNRLYSQIRSATAATQQLREYIEGPNEVQSTADW